MKLDITVIVAVKNEELNIEKCLNSLAPSIRIIVVDSGSSDRTVDIATICGADVIQFVYAGGYPKKRQWALDTLSIDSQWIMMIDADEVVPEELWKEINYAITSDQTCDAYLITKGFHFMGKRFRFGGFSFQAVLLFKTDKARYERLIEDVSDGLDMEIHERVVVDGTIGALKTPLIHDDYKGLEAYIHRHNKYSTWEAKLRYNFITTGKYGEDTIIPRWFGNSQERRRALKAFVIRLPMEHWLWFAYHYFLKLGCFEGTAGLIACRIRSNYIAMVRAKMIELKQPQHDVAHR